MHCAAYCMLCYIVALIMLYTYKTLDPTGAYSLTKNQLSQYNVHMNIQEDFSVHNNELCCNVKYQRVQNTV